MRFYYMLLILLVFPLAGAHKAYAQAITPLSGQQGTDKPPLAAASNPTATDISAQATAMAKKLSDSGNPTTVTAMPVPGTQEFKILLSKAQNGDLRALSQLHNIMTNSVINTAREDVQIKRKKDCETMSPNIVGTGEKPDMERFRQLCH